MERLIVERKSKEEVSRAACHSVSLHSLLVDIYIFAPLKEQGFLSFGKKKSKPAWKRNQRTRSLFRVTPVARQNKIVQLKWWPVNKESVSIAPDIPVRPNLLYFESCLPQIYPVKKPTTSGYKVHLKTKWLVKEGEKFSEWSLPRRISASCHASGAM